MSYIFTNELLYIIFSKDFALKLFYYEVEQNEERKID